MSDSTSQRRLSNAQRTVLGALLAAGATGEVLGSSRTGDVDRNSAPVRRLVEDGHLAHNHYGRTFKALEERGLIGGREVLLNSEWGNWCVWWLTPEGREAIR